MIDNTSLDSSARHSQYASHIVPDSEGRHCLNKKTIKVARKTLNTVYQARRRGQNSMKRLMLTTLAKRIGTNKSYISRIEKGLTVSSVATFYRIVNALGLTVELTAM